MVARALLLYVVARQFGVVARVFLGSCPNIALWLQGSFYGVLCGCLAVARVLLSGC